MTDAPDDMEDMTIGGMLRSQRGQYDDLVKAADAMAEVVLELQDALSESREGQIVNYGEHALTAYRKAKENLG